MNVLFEERQRLPPVLVSAVLVVVGGALIATDRADWRELAFVAGFTAVLLWLFRMRTTVTDDALLVVLFPVPRKEWLLEDLERCEVVEYRPLLHYGGWGWRWGGKRGWAYTARGKRGVKVHPRTGRPFLVGSQRPEELAAAIEGARRARRSEA
jgi:hypothetical protein